MQLPPEMAQHGLYDETGRHLGGLYQSLMVDGRLTPAHTAVMACRPVQRLFWDYRTCSDPASNLALVWAMSLDPNPLATGWGVIPYLVQVLDAGQSVQLHAAGEDEINRLCAVLAGLVGGGHV